VPPRRGEVWLFDCGMVEKVRPVLIFSVPFAKPPAGHELLSVQKPRLANFIVSHTTSGQLYC